MASLIEFVNRVRTLQDLPALWAIDLRDTQPDDATESVLAKAMAVEIGDREDGSVWVMRFDDRPVARRIGIVMGLPWRPDPPEVELPMELVDVCVSEHFGLIEGDDLGFLRCWWVPLGEGDRDLRPLAVSDDIVPNGDWKLPRSRATSGV